MKNVSGANFCFWVSLSVVFILVLFCLCFCFNIWFVVPENVSRKFSSGQVRCLNKLSGASFCFMVSVLVCWQFLPLLEGGNAVRFFLFVFFVSGSASFVVFYRSSLLRVVVGKIFGRELLFYGVGVGLVCFGAVLPMFCFIFVFSLPKLSQKNSLDVRSGVSGFFPSSFGFFADVVVLFVFVSFFFEERQLR